MSVTLEVSKLSSWLNADAYCGESKGGHTERGELRGGRARQMAENGGGVQWRTRLQIEGRARGGAHVEHLAHVRDAGGVEAQRLVERRRVLPRVERRACGAGRGCGSGGVRPACRGELDCRFGAGHEEERTANIPRMVVTLEVSKLSGWLNADAPCRESKGGHTLRDEVRAGRREAAGDRGARSVRGRARLQIGGRARGGAHPEHAVHALDAGGVEVQRLVERRRILPSRKEDM